MNQEELQHFGSLEAKLAALSTEVRLHHEMVQEGLKSIQEATRERERVSREEITILSQTVRTVSEWQIGHANTTYHRDLADRVTETETNLAAIAELHIERQLKEFAEDRAKIRAESAETAQALKSEIRRLEAEVTVLKQKSHDEEIAAQASGKLLKRQSAAIAFALSIGGSAVGIVVGLNLA